MFLKLKQFITTKVNQVKEKIYQKLPLAKHIFPGWGFGSAIPVKGILGLYILNYLGFSNTVNNILTIPTIHTIPVLLYILIHARLWKRSRALEAAITSSNLDNIVKHCSQGANPSESFSIQWDDQYTPVSIFESANSETLTVSLFGFEVKPKPKPSTKAMEVAHFFRENISQLREKEDMTLINSVQKAMHDAGVMRIGQKTLLEYADEFLSQQHMPEDPPDSLTKFRKAELENRVRNVQWSYMNFCQKIQHTPEELSRGVKKGFEDLSYHLMLK